MNRAPAGTIYDRGYRHYDGPREGRSRAVRAIVAAGVRRVLGLKRSWKAKVVPFFLLALAFVPVLAFIAIRVLLGEVAGPFIGYDRYLRVVAVVLLLFAATAGPELLCPDRRSHVLALVFTRPVTRLDYLAAKLAALLAVMALAAALPLVILFVGNTLTAPRAVTYLRGHAGDLWRILAAGALLTLYYGIVALAVASLTARRSVATAAMLGVFLVSSALARVLFFATSFPGRRWFALLALPELATRVVDRLFGAAFDPGSLAELAGLGGPAYLAAVAGLIVAAGAVLTWRILRLAP